VNAVYPFVARLSAERWRPVSPHRRTLRKAATLDEATSAFLSSKKFYEGRDVAGLGDLAYRTAAPPQLNVLTGRNWLIIAAGAFPGADVSLQEKAAREIMKNIHY